MLATSSAAARTAVLPLFATAPAPDRVSGLFHAATEFARLLGQGRALDTRALRSAMEAAFGASDAAGAWAWKDAYEAAEAAQVLFLRKFGRAMRTRAGSPAAMLDMLNRLAERLPSQTRRSEESNRFQQFSTPIALGLAAAEAAAITPDDLVLEPRPGRAFGGLRRTGRRQTCAERDHRHPRRVACASLPRLRRHTTQCRAHKRSARSGDAAQRRADEPALLIVAPCREALRRGCLPASRLGFRAAARGRTPRRDHRAQCRSRGAGLARGVRAAAGTGGRVVFSAAIAGQAYARHGTAMDTRLTIIDRVPAETRANSRRRRARLPLPPNCSIRSSGWCRRARH